MHDDESNPLSEARRRLVMARDLLRCRYPVRDSVSGEYAMDTPQAALDAIAAIWRAYDAISALMRSPE